MKFDYLKMLIHVMKVYSDVAIATKVKLFSLQTTLFAW